MLSRDSWQNNKKIIKWFYHSVFFVQNIIYGKNLQKRTRSWLLNLPHSSSPNLYKYFSLVFNFSMFYRRSTTMEQDDLEMNIETASNLMDKVANRLRGISAWQLAPLPSAGPSTASFAWCQWLSSGSKLETVLPNNLCHRFDKKLWHLWIYIKKSLEGHSWALKGEASLSWSQVNATNDLGTI